VEPVPPGDAAHPAAPPRASGSDAPDLQALQEMTARFAPVDLGADISALPLDERRVLARLVEAAQLMDALFLRQVWAGNMSMLLELLRDTTEIGRARLRYFLINKGPWSRLDHNAPFVPGAPPKPQQANFYPGDATKAEIAAWLASQSETERRRATGFFNTIRRTPEGALTAVPYSLEYQGEIERVAALLRAAAALTRQPTLQAFLERRAAALSSDDYYESDVAWMELDASIEPTIGPYEVYEDEWFNYKAAFEAFITVRDDDETRRLAGLGAARQEIEDNLPIDPEHRNPRLGAMAPIRVVNTIFSAGDANKGVQTAAFNLPNDERVIAEKGSKSVMLKNNQEAKFRMVLQPIAKVVLAAADQGRVAFDAFFTHILLHELMHGLGPHNIRVSGRGTTVRQELEDTYSAVEEAKADVSGLFAVQFLVDRGKLDRRLEETVYTTFLASMFRSLRFGINEAHGRGVAIQLNYFLDHGGVRVASDGTFAVDAGRIRENVTGLTRSIMTVQALGAYSDAKNMIDTLGILRPPVQRLLDRLVDVPVDIQPRFVTAARLKIGEAGEM
jgi:hypothetical protein